MVLGTGKLATGNGYPRQSLAVSQPRVRLAHLPTALEEMPRLTDRLGGPRLLVKRNDQTGLATGGNKARKLEFLVAAAQAQGADTLVTSGSVQSNHCRQTAAAAARCGLHCVLLLGAELRIGEQSLEDAAEELRRAGRKPYVIPVGGSNATGATGYVTAMEELMAQLEERDEEVDWIITATGSGGTQGGMAVGARAHGFGGRILGISVSRNADQTKQRLAQVANDTSTHLGLDHDFAADEFNVNDDFLGGGYGVMAIWSGMPSTPQPRPRAFYWTRSTPAGPSAGYSH